MGNRARIRADARKRAKVQKRNLQAMVADFEASPEFQDLIARVDDPRVREIMDRDHPAQKARLHAAGWVWRKSTPNGSVWDLPRTMSRIVHSVLPYDDGEVWGHVSISHRNGGLPGWSEVRNAQWLFYPEAKGLIIVAPEIEHVDISEVAHVWTCLTTGVPVPDFRLLGTAI